MTLIRFGLRITLLTVLLFQVSQAITWAAAASPADIEEQNRRARQQAEEQQRKQQEKDTFLQGQKAADKDTSLPAETPSFLITKLQLEGDPNGEFPWAKGLLEPYQGKRIGLQGVNLIAKRLTNAFIDRGFVTTRVVIPEQDISTGTLRLVVVPGVIHAIRFQDPKVRANWQTAFPTRPGRLLNLRDLEQGLEQMKRLPSQDVEMQLVPGEKPGESDVVLTVKQAKPWKISMSLDDSGSESTGKLQTSYTFAVDNLFGINDLFNVSFNSDAEHRRSRLGTRGDSIYFSFPWGNSTFTLSSSSYKYHQVLQGYGQDFTSWGRSRTTEFKLSQLLARDQKSKTHLDLSIIKGDSHSFIDDAEIEVQRKKTTALKVGLSHRRYIGQAILDLSLAHKQGVPWFGAMADPFGGQPDSPTTRYRLWTLEASLTAPVKLGAVEGRYIFSFRGQTTRSLLYGSEFFSIGNRYTVRGFDGEQTLSAESGWYIQNELAFPLDKTGQEIFLGLDIGKIHGPSSEYYSSRRLIGSVLGVRGRIGSLQYEGFVGWPISHPAELTVANPTYGFQIVCQL